MSKNHPAVYAESELFNQIENNIQNLSKIFRNISNGHMTNVDVNDSMTLLRNSIASATCIDNVNFRCQFFRIICDEKYLFIKSIQSFFDRQFDDLYTKLVSNSIVENDDVSLMFILKSLQFFFNLSNLNPQQFEFKNFSEFHSFILNKKYYK